MYYLFGVLALICALAFPGAGISSVPTRQAPVAARLYFQYPHAGTTQVSVETAQQQAAGIAAGRKLDVAAVRQLVNTSAQQERHGGQAQVNLLALNLMLDLASHRAH